MNNYLLCGALLIFFVAFVATFIKSQKAWYTWISETEPTAFHCLDEIIHGKRWVGEKLQLVYSGDLQDDKEPPLGVAFKEQLCKSKSGLYILLTVTMNGETQQCSVVTEAIFDQDRAKEWLERHKEAYISEFGPVENA